LYAKYIGIISGLPEDANLWSLTLCSTFFSALSTHLKDKMEETDFVMPPLNNHQPKHYKSVACVLCKQQRLCHTRRFRKRKNVYGAYFHSCASIVEV